MINADADQLAQALHDTWPDGPRKHVWFAALQPVEHVDIAWDAYRTARISEQSMTVARFMEHYRAARRVTIARPEPTPPDRPGNWMSPTAYRELLEQRANGGDLEAQQELSNLQKVTR